MKDKLERLHLNYSNARKSWESWHFMNEITPLDFNIPIPDYGSSTKRKVDQNVLLSHLRYLAWKDFNIELYKIIKDNPNTRDNIFLLLREFSKLRPDLKEQIGSNLEQLELLKPEIEKLTNLRDKFFAHLDPEHLKYHENGSLKPYHDILMAVESAIITLTSKEDFLKILDKIPSRSEFNLDIK